MIKFKITNNKKLLYDYLRLTAVLLLKAAAISGSMLMVKFCLATKD